MFVHCRCQYLTDVVFQMRHDDYNAIHMVKAVKGMQLPANSYHTVKIGGLWHTIRDGNKDDALKWFGEWSADIIDRTSVGLTVLVPVPNSSAVVGGPANFRTALIAQEIQNQCKTPAVVAPHLRWKSVRPKSTNADSRRPEVLYPDLVQEYAFPQGRIVLIDDVYTTGGHFIASAWRIRFHGGDVDIGICCGRTEHVQIDDPFSLLPFELIIPAIP